MKTKTSDLNQTLIVPAQKLTRSDLVRGVFEDVSRYVNSRQVDIRVRVETVREFAGNVAGQRLLDIGCGNGAISLPLLTQTSHLTLLDLSASMLATAQTNVPAHLASQVELRNGDFATASFAPGSFDLIISVGVLAHVDSPSQFISKIADTLRPGGRLIIAFTDSRHPAGRVARFAGSIKEAIAPAKYSVNLLSSSQVGQLFEHNGLKLVSAYRYAELPIPGMSKVLGEATLYKGVRSVFGTVARNRNAWLGNEHICLLTKQA